MIQVQVYSVWSWQGWDEDIRLADLPPWVAYASVLHSSSYVVAVRVISCILGGLWKMSTTCMGFKARFSR